MQWLSDRVSDYGARGRGSKPTYRRVVSFSKILYSPKVLVIHRKRWLCPNMTEKIVDLDVKPQHKQTNIIRVGIM